MRMLWQRVQEMRISVYRLSFSKEVLTERGGTLELFTTYMQVDLVDAATSAPTLRPMLRQKVVKTPMKSSLSLFQVLLFVIVILIIVAVLLVAWVFSLPEESNGSERASFLSGHDHSQWFV